MQFVDFRLKIRHAFRKYGKVIMIVFMIWVVIFFINYLLKNREVIPEATTTYQPHVSVMNPSSSAPSSVSTTAEDKIQEYVTYCKNGEFDKAYRLLSSDCKQYEFNNDLNEFVQYINKKIPSSSTQYSIQNYSNATIGDKKVYVYEVKYTPDLLATGLTNTTYAYATEKIAFYRDEDKKLQMTAGNFMYHADVKSITENEYLKIDVIDKLVNYSVERYTVKITNRSNYTIVIADGVQEDEVVLALNNETRNRQEIRDIILEPNQTIDTQFVFDKFADDGDSSNNLVFSAIRVMENYSGTVDDNGNDIEESVIQSEIDNAIAKFSMQVSVK